MEQEENIDRILQDFKDAASSKYAAAHVYFTEHLPKDLLARLKTSPLFVSKVRTMRELNLKFLAIEQQVMLLLPPLSPPLSPPPHTSVHRCICTSVHSSLKDRMVHNMEYRLQITF